MARIYAKNFGYGDPWGTDPKRGEDLCTIAQNVTPIDAIVAEISVIGHRKKHSNQLMTFQTDVWRVINLAAWSTDGGPVTLVHPKPPLMKSK